MDKEIAIYGMTVADIEEQYMNSLTAKACGLEMVVMGILSDCQEVVAFQNSTTDSDSWKMASNDLRKQMNVAKFILSKMMSTKESV